MNNYNIRVADTSLRVIIKDEQVHFKIDYSKDSRYITYDTAAVYSLQGQQLYFTLKYKNGKYLEPSEKLALSNSLALFVDQLTAEDFRNIAIEGLNEQISREETSQLSSATKLKALLTHKAYLAAENVKLTSFEETIRR